MINYTKQAKWPPAAWISPLARASVPRRLAIRSSDRPACCGRGAAGARAGGGGGGVYLDDVAS